MLADLRAEADVRGGRINIEWTWRAPGDRPGLRLLRRRYSYPTGPAEGAPVLDLADLFTLPDQKWARVARRLYLAQNVAPESGIRQAEVSLYLYDPNEGTPSRVLVRYFDSVTDSMPTVDIGDVSRLESSEAATPPWKSIETLGIFATPGGGPEQPMGQIVVSTGHEDGITQDKFEWIPSGGSPGTVDFSLVVNQESIVTLDEVLSEDTGDWNRHVMVQDAGLEPDVVLYYAVFAPDPGNPGGYVSDRGWRAEAMATGHYGLREQLYRLLPAVHQRYDEPAREDRGNGQLRAFLNAPGLALDHMRGLADGLRIRHDVYRVGARMLPHLARWIGWEPDLTSSVPTQRNDIQFAPEIYRTVGTLPNLCALVNRVTGWECQTKEFVHNVFLTNAPEIIHLSEIWGRRNDGTGWTDPTSITQTEQIDGRPTAVLDSGGDVWLFWHSDRSGRREIWLQRLDGVDPAPRRAVLDAPDDAPDLTYFDEAPAAVVEGGDVLLAWSSNRDGAWNIWSRAFSGLPGGPPVQLTNHMAADQWPALVRREVAGQTWLFWQSDRRGPTDIWSRKKEDGGGWETPDRVKANGGTASIRREMPAAVVDASDRIWLFWVADLGDRRNLYLQTYDGVGWSLPEVVTQGPQRDEAPAAAFWNGKVWLFWHSNRDGYWQIWARVHDGSDWGEPFQVTTHPSADEEPAVVVDASGRLRLFFRSRRRGDWYKSRTIDTSDATMLGQMGTFEDRAHYTYDTAEGNEDWYTRHVVGVYLTPDTTDAGVVAQVIGRAATFADPFRPLPTRLVWQSGLTAMDEPINTDGLIDEEFADDIA